MPFKYSLMININNTEKEAVHALTLAINRLDVGGSIKRSPRLPARCAKQKESGREEFKSERYIMEKPKPTPPSGGGWVGNKFRRIEQEPAETAIPKGIKIEG